MLANAVKTGMEVADDVLEGQSFKESAKKRVPAGIKRTVQNLDWSRDPASRGGVSKEEKEENEVTFSRNGFHSRAVVRMYKVGVGPVFRSADAD